MRVVGREHQIDRRLAILRARTPAACPACPSPRPSSSSFCSSTRLDQLLFFVAHELLAVVSRGSRFFGATSVSCVTTPSPLSSGTRNRLLSRTKVTAVSWRAQRGFDFAAGRARDLAARAARPIEQHDVAAIDEQDAPVRLVPAAVDRRRAASLVVGQLARRRRRRGRRRRSTLRPRPGLRHSKYSFAESPDQRRPVGG